MAKTEPIKHHYIPQFILRGFLGEDGLFYYWDNDNKYLSKRNTKSVFMNNSMYRSEEINPENPVEVENNLSKFEQEMAPLFKRLCSNDEVVLTRRELEALRIFLSLLSFRSDLRMKQYKDKKFNESTEATLNLFKGEQDFDLFWKNEINALAKCRSFEEVMSVEGVDPIIKMDFSNDLKGYYMTLIEARGQEFIISDVYPTLEIYPVAPTINIHLHAIYPISPTRAILLNNIFFRKVLMDKQDPIYGPMIEFSQMKGNMLKEPKNYYPMGPTVHTPDDKYFYRPVKIYENDVTYINMLFLNETRMGFAFRNIDKIKASISRYNSTNREYNKNNFDFLETKLEDENND